LRGEDFEQHEIEFLPVEVEDAADQMIIAKWILRMLAYKYNVEISFAPKISVGEAGSGLHIHMMLEKDGRNAMVSEGGLSDVAHSLMAGILDLAPALTAFGNTIPTSYLRLVPHQEAPTSICWGDRNRSALIRVPLGWRGGSHMTVDANPAETRVPEAGDSKQTVEFRAPDGSAEKYKLLAGRVVGAGHGIEMKDSLTLAERLYVDVNIFDDKHSSSLDSLDKLPGSCWESAAALEKLRAEFEKDNIFPPEVIDHTISELRAFDDKDLSERLYGKDEEIKALVHKYIHIS